MPFRPSDIRTGMKVRIDTNIDAYAPQPERAVERIVLEVNPRDGAIRISEGWFMPRRVLDITETRGSSTRAGAR